MKKKDNRATKDPRASTAHDQLGRNLVCPGEPPNARWNRKEQLQKENKRAA